MQSTNNKRFQSTTSVNAQASFNFEKTVNVKTSDNECFKVTPRHLQCMPGLVSLCQQDTEHLALADYEQFCEIKSEAFSVVQQCCELECSQGPESACSTGGCVEQCLQSQPDELVVHITLCARLLGCKRIYDLCVRHVSVCFQRMEVHDIRASLNVHFDWHSVHKVKQVCDQTKFCLLMRNEKCDSWFKKCCRAIRGLFHHIKCKISLALHALFCELLPCLTYAVICRLSLTCKWIRKVCLPFLFEVIIVRPCLWFHDHKDKCEKMITKFLCWKKQHCHVRTLVVSAKLKVDFHLDVALRKKCQTSTITAADLVFKEVCKPESSLCPKTLCLKKTPVHPCWEPVIKNNFETVTINKAPCVKNPQQQYEYEHTEQSSSKITSLTINSHELNSTAVHALFTEHIKTVKIVHKYSKVETVQQSCTDAGVHYVCLDEKKEKCKKKSKREKCDSDSDSSSSSSSSDSSSSSSSSDSDCEKTCHTPKPPCPTPKPPCPKPKAPCPKPKRVPKKKLPGCFCRVKKESYDNFKRCGCRTKLPALEKIRFEFVEQKTNVSIVTTKHLVRHRAPQGQRC